MGEGTLRSVLAFAHLPIATDLCFEFLLEIGGGGTHFSGLDCFDFAGVKRVLLVIRVIEDLIGILVELLILTTVAEAAYGLLLPTLSVHVSLWGALQEFTVEVRHMVQVFDPDFWYVLQLLIVHRVHVSLGELPYVRSRVHGFTGAQLRDRVWLLTGVEGQLRGFKVQFYMVCLMQAGVED